jgi:hypothetical protein
VTSNQILFNPFLKESYSPEERSLQGWIVIFCFLLISLAFYLGPAASLRLIYPIIALITAVFLYLRHPILYLGFTWWMWFLSPLFTRLVDLKVGWDDTRQMLVAPYLVVFVSIGTLFRYLPSAYRQGALSFILAFAGVFYGFLVGIVQNPPLPVARNLLDWLIPLLFGFHLFINWRDYPSYRQNFQRTFLWCVLILGIYGIYQFVIAPDWDTYWLVKSKQTSSSGNPVPFGMRVWSTMHSIGPFGATMQAGLLLLFTRTGPLILPASAFGYVSFLLAQTRTNWGGWLLGMIMILGSVKARIQMRLIVILLVMVVCVAPLLTIEPISTVLATRFESLGNLEEDSSFRDRSSSYDRNLSIALSNTLGNGFGSSLKVDEKTGRIEIFVIDSGILDTFFTIGWFGAIPYLSGLILILYQVSQYTESRFDSFMSVARAVGVSAFCQLIIGSGMLSIAGMILWGFLAMAMAGHKYYQHQGITTSNQYQSMAALNQGSST